MGQAPKPMEKIWDMDVEGAPGLMGVTPDGPVFMEPYATVEETDHHGNEVAIVVASVVTIPLTPAHATVTLVVVLPAMCGHYTCGQAVELSLN
jgi:hypothetical protein